MPDVEIVVSTVDNTTAGTNSATTNLEKLQKNTKSAEKSAESFTDKIGKSIKELTGFSIAQIGMTAAVGAAAKMARDALVDYSNYVEQIDKLTQSTGLSAEEMSRMVQVADDFRVSVGSLENALKVALQNGFNPSIDSLAKLSDKIKTIHDPAKKAEELTKIFGRSWQDILPMLDRGGDAIRDAAAGISDSLIVTDQAIENNRLYQESVDNLGDAWMGFKYAVTRDVLPVLAELLSANAKSIEEMNNGASRMEVISNRRVEAINKVKAAQEAAAPKDISYWSNFVEAAGLGADKLDDLSAATDTATAAAEKLKGQFGDLKDIIAGQFGKELDDYNSKMGDLTIEHRNLAEKIDVLEKKAYLTPEQKQELQDLRDQLWENRDAMGNLADAHEEAMKRMAFNMLLERAASDGLTGNELKNLTTIGQAWGLYDQKTADVINSINENIALLDTSNPQGLLDILRNILGLPTSKTFDFVVNWTQNGSVPAGLGDVGLDPAPVDYGPGDDYDPGDTSEPRAAGGRVGAYRTVKVGEFGEELFRPDVGGTIVPTNSTMQQPAGEAVTYGPIYIQVLSSDPRGAAREIESILGDNARLARLAGAQYQGA